MSVTQTAFWVFVALLVGVPILSAIARFFCIYTTIDECRGRVYLLFGKVVGVLDQPGICFPIGAFGPKALLVRFFGNVYDVDLRLDQTYLRSQPVNTEEGTPMGIGVWYEMRVGDPVSFLFENTDPAGSLRANVANAAVRELSNLPLGKMLEDRHSMSRAVRAEVSPAAEAWGYRLGSVYIRKVHFRDDEMIAQIEQKVVNRLRQVTSAIRQAGDNQVNIIDSKAEKEAAVELARAAAIRPQIVGEAFREISEEPGTVQALLRVLEVNKLLESDAELTLVPRGGDTPLLRDLIAAKAADRGADRQSPDEN